MGRRSRQRAHTPERESSRAPVAAAESSRAPAPPPRRSRRDEAPLPPWGRFPLIELCALSAIVLGIWGLFAGGTKSGVLLTGAMLLGSVAGLEIAIREHVGGYRSHTLVLAGVLGVATLALLAFARAERTIMLGGAAAVLVVGVVGLRALFKRRSGGVGMRVR
jgi:hypothetical protein